MTSNTPLLLTAGRLEMRLSPSIGGSISALEWIDGDRRVAVLRNCNSCHENVLDAASFPLVPYVNRIRDGRFTFRGRDVRLAPNMPGDISPLHGQGWLAPWRVERASPAEALLSYRHAAGAWPWDYHAAQLFALIRAAFAAPDVPQSVGRADPCGLGQHPYFNCGAETRIATEVTHAWTIDAHVLPVERVPATAASTSPTAWPVARTLITASAAGAAWRG